jgi:branched-chain amino acid transport system substrate-binding protein
VKLGKIVAVLAALCLLTAMCVAGADAAKAPYVIGAIFDVTGTGAPLGTPEKETVQMVQVQMNLSGGINGHPVKFIIMDNGSDVTNSVMAAKRLIEADHVKIIIGPSTTGTTLAIADMCERARVPLVSCAAGNKITDPVKPFVFKTAQSDVHAIAKLIDYLKSKHIKRVAFINVSNAFGMSGKQQMEIQAAKAGIALSAKEAFGPDDSDMTPQLVRIKGSKPQAVICWGTNPGPAIVARNMKQLGMRMPLLMSHGVANKKFIQLAGPAANGVVFPAGRLIVADQIPDSDPQKKILLGYSAHFKKATGKDADAFGGHAWDAAQVALRALKAAGDNPVKMRAAIEKMKFVGVSGIFKFSPREHNGLSKASFVMVQIKNGKWTLLK